MLNIVVQAAALSALSNVLAQLISNYQENKPLTSFDLKPIIIFVVYTILNTPINVLWQDWLEDAFPGAPTPPPIRPGDEKKPVQAPASNTRNLVIKWVLDQTVGAAVNIGMFIAGVGALKGQGKDQIVASLQNDMWPIFMAGTKLWPAVSVISFSVVPVDKRVIFGSVAGVVWGIYLSLAAK
ncbi:hypothetical protein EJ06DRAFT_470206 [Trichodelitschia bisporula]|uniref:Integral membrane protein-like protein n=1 Tax=Trichodelitschia bisporula TaxID=703511 RepID=A0A6G1I8H6_9PEZI|nr:hypothetical protein EJ06DRAFT_470206 [Trichodelitschia bisporula]